MLVIVTTAVFVYSLHQWSMLCHMSQKEAKFERQEDRLHHQAVNAALHGNIGKAIVLEVPAFVIVFHE